MTNKELIILLLEYPMDAKVKIDTEEDSTPWKNVSEIHMEWDGELIVIGTKLE